MTRRVHIVGCRRSGTTLMMELLWYAYRFSGRHEHEISVFEPVPAGESLYLTKKPSDTTRIEEIFRADNELFLVAMLRDPRAVMTSKHPSRPDVYFSDYYRWREYVRALSEYQDHPRCVLVRYEDLVTDPDAVQARIEQHCDFLQRRERAFSQFPLDADVSNRAERSLGGAREMEQARIEGWREHLPRVKGQILEHADLPRMLVETGYEADEAWVEVLDDVQPYRQRYKDGGPGRLKRMEANVRYALKTQRYLKDLESR